MSVNPLKYLTKSTFTCKLSSSDTIWKHNITLALARARFHKYFCNFQVSLQWKAKKQKSKIHGTSSVKYNVVKINTQRTHNFWNLNAQYGIEFAEGCGLQPWKWAPLIEMLLYLFLELLSWQARKSQKWERFGAQCWTVLLKSGTQIILSWKWYRFIDLVPSRAHLCGALVTNLVDECLSSSRAQQKDGPPESVPVTVQFLGFHCVEEAGKDPTDVLVNPLQGGVQPLARSLVQEPLQPSNIWQHKTKRI